MNPGKIFEEDFKRSVPKTVMCLRIPDPIAHMPDDKLAFGARCPFDFILFKTPRMYALELKSTGDSSISFEGCNPMIKQHQIDALQKVAPFHELYPGFLLNFRRTQATYFIHINSFLAWRDLLHVKSINEKAANEMGLYIPSWVNRTRIHYDLSPLFERE